MKKEFNDLKIEIISINNEDIIKTSNNEAYVSWWGQSSNTEEETDKQEDQ